MTAPILEIQDLTRRFGGLTAVDAVSLDLGDGEVLGLIGPNGAGKTTTFNLIAGAVAPTSGDIRLSGRSIVGLPPHRIARSGIMRTFQHNMAFDSMSVLDNVLIGAHIHVRTGLWRIALGMSSAAEDERALRAAGTELLESVGLGEYAERGVEALSFGQGRLLEIARALAGRPRVILFDEPAAGLTAVETAHLSKVIRAVAASGIAVLLIEHDMNFLLPLADRVVVLNFGRKIADGPPDHISADPAVVAAYLGKRPDA
jgi:ABC-type branched-subunit amino acid transport system ATPase component